MARQETGKTKPSYQPRGSREDLLKNPDFRNAFDAARENIKSMNVQFVAARNAIEQTILEVYTAVQTKAKYNNFENH